MTARKRNRNKRKNTPLASNTTKTSVDVGVQTENIDNITPDNTDSLNSLKSISVKTDETNSTNSSSDELSVGINIIRTPVVTHNFHNEKESINEGSLYSSIENTDYSSDDSTMASEEKDKPNTPWTIFSRSSSVRPIESLKNSATSVANNETLQKVKRSIFNYRVAKYVAGVIGVGLFVLASIGTGGIFPAAALASALPFAITNNAAFGMFIGSAAAFAGAIYCHEKTEPDNNPMTTQPEGADVKPSLWERIKSSAESSSKKIKSPTPTVADTVTNTDTTTVYSSGMLPARDSDKTKSNETKPKTSSSAWSWSLFGKGGSPVGSKYGITGNTNSGQSIPSTAPDTDTDTVTASDEDDNGFILRFTGC